VKIFITRKVLRAMVRPLQAAGAHPEARRENPGSVGRESRRGRRGAQPHGERKKREEIVVCPLHVVGGGVVGGVVGVGRRAYYI